jgi:hypothetical protein
MTKLHIIHAIESAETYHEEQLNKVAMLLDGKDIENPTPTNKEECNFGKWLYGDAKEIQNILGLQFYDNIELMHGFWHSEYQKIYEIFYDVEKNSILKFLFGNRKNVKPEMLQKAKEYYKELQAITKNLLKALYVSKKRVLALSESFFV